MICRELATDYGEVANHGLSRLQRVLGTQHQPTWLAALGCRWRRQRQCKGYQQTEAKNHGKYETLAHPTTSVSLIHLLIVG